MWFIIIYWNVSTFVIKLLSTLFLICCASLHFQTACMFIDTAYTMYREMLVFFCTGRLVANLKEFKMENSFINTSTSNVTHFGVAALIRKHDKIFSMWSNVHHAWIYFTSVKSFPVIAHELCINKTILHLTSMHHPYIYE